MDLAEALADDSEAWFSAYVVLIDSDDAEASDRVYLRAKFESHGSAVTIDLDRSPTLVPHKPGFYHARIVGDFGWFDYPDRVHLPYGSEFRLEQPGTK
jgi:hypothetical protein